jgi:hypothetical protein
MKVLILSVKLAIIDNGRIDSDIRSSSSATTSCKRAVSKSTDSATEQTFPRPLLSNQSHRELMGESLDPLSDRACRMTDAYNTGIEITEQLREGDSLL